ncbi:homoserine dehydrogenase [Halobacillus yeomjeoni]|uniref:homoserine dehydrogenase n=1 Tax=Halobacillus yeomjeoni TaxID=311194 RepID=UPI0021E5E7EB|nr:homoserine dehydrogenase [Halobacillus yeomjeoni]
MAIKLAIVGFGGVGQSLTQILQDREEMLRSEYGVEVIIVAVSDLMKGSVYDSTGLDIDTLFQCLQNQGTVDAYPDQDTVVKGWTSLETITNSNADVIVEATFTDVHTGEPAISHCLTAFKNRKSVITTNKGPVALAYRELAEVAVQNQQFFGIEGTVMSGTPALRLPLETLSGNEIKEITGILNGTTNYMLCEMEKGLSYEEALKNAQNNGYAEADPTNDVEGYDARYKAVILANYVMGIPLTPDEVECTGITGLTREDITKAGKDEETWRLITRIQRKNEEVTATVKPERISKSSPLASVQGAANAVIYDCDLAGPIMLTGAGAGLKETGFSLLIDLIHYRKQQALQKL